ncbi:MAG: hypothetical protein BGO98_18420 [Myxococcales bacterium 68-20]|nr:MAG: hypothetical protein BGO98_18420 [Myxococcales bacterium 68-20]
MFLPPSRRPLCIAEATDAELFISMMKSRLARDRHGRPRRCRVGRDLPSRSCARALTVIPQDV